MINNANNTITTTLQSIKERLHEVLYRFLNKPIDKKLVNQIKYEFKQEISNMVNEGLVPEKELENNYYILHHYKQNILTISDEANLEPLLMQGYKII